MVWGYDTWGSASWGSTNNNTYYPLQDGLGSVRSLIATDRTVQGLADYTPYGTTQGTIPSPFGFTGCQFTPYTDPQSNSQENPGVHGQREPSQDPLTAKGDHP